MKRNLGRLLQVRTLLEEASRLDLERKHAETLSLAGAAEARGQLALAARTDALRILSENRPREPWMLDVTDADILRFIEGRLRALAAVSRSTADRARDELLARRLERQQVESLIRDALQLKSQDQMRREQQRTDDWYQQRRRLLGKRGAR